MGNELEIGTMLFDPLVERKGLISHIKEVPVSGSAFDRLIVKTNMCIIKWIGGAVEYYDLNDLLTLPARFVIIDDSEI